MVGGAFNSYATAIPNNVNTPSQNINNSVDPVLDGDDYAAGGATTTCIGIPFSEEPSLYMPPPIGPLRLGKICPTNIGNNLESFNQITTYLNQHSQKASPNTIYIIWGGANNAFILLEEFTKGAITQEQAEASMKDAADDIVYDVSYLESHGASYDNICLKLA